jgi:hypothetical protein
MTTAENAERVGGILQGVVRSRDWPGRAWRLSAVRTAGQRAAVGSGAERS